MLPRLVQHIPIKEFESIQIELYSAPGMGTEQLDEIIGELLFRKVVDLMAKTIADSTNGCE